jgi:hypothetical protein
VHAAAAFPRVKVGKTLAASWKIARANQAQRD